DSGRGLDGGKRALGVGLRDHPHPRDGGLLLAALPIRELEDDARDRIGAAGLDHGERRRRILSSSSVGDSPRRTRRARRKEARGEDSPGFGFESRKRERAKREKEGSETKATDRIASVFFAFSRFKTEPSATCS